MGLGVGLGFTVHSREVIEVGREGGKEADVVAGLGSGAAHLVRARDRVRGRVRVRDAWRCVRPPGEVALGEEAATCPATWPPATWAAGCGLREERRFFLPGVAAPSPTVMPPAPKTEEKEISEPAKGPAKTGGSRELPECTAVRVS